MFWSFWESFLEPKKHPFSKKETKGKTSYPKPLYSKQQENPMFICDSDSHYSALKTCPTHPGGQKQWHAVENIPPKKSWKGENNFRIPQKRNSLVIKHPLSWQCCESEPSSSPWEHISCSRSVLSLMMIGGDEPWIQNGVRLIAPDSRRDFKAFAPLLSFTSEMKIKAVMSPINSNLVASTATGAMTTCCQDRGREKRCQTHKSTINVHCSQWHQPDFKSEGRDCGVRRRSFVFGVCSSTPFQQACHFGFSPTYFMPTSKPPCIKEDGHLHSPNGFRKAHFPVKQNGGEVKWISCVYYEQCSGIESCEGSEGCFDMRTLKQKDD